MPRDPLSGIKIDKKQPHWGVQAARKRYNISATCGDGCLDKLVAAVRRAKPTPVRVVAGALALGAAAAAARGSGGSSSSSTSGSISSSSSSSRFNSLGTSSGGGGSTAERPEPLLLLGLLSGSQPRRDMLRCSWMRVAALSQHGVRVLFIVGKANAENSPDVLPVDVVEGAFMRSKADALRNTTRTFDVKKQIRTGSVTTYWKLVEWLKYAATQPEPMVGRADDDVFVSPRMLIAHARLLLRHASLPLPGNGVLRPDGSSSNGADAGRGLVFAGVFEWYSWRTRTLMSTGFGLSAGASRTRRKKQWRNCSATGAGTSVDDPCTGPVAFAKGPLMMMSTRAVQRVISSPLFRRDVSQAHLLSEGKAKAYKGPGSGRIDDDVQLGFWMSQLPGLRVVTFRRYLAWHDRWKAGVTDMLPARFSSPTRCRGRASPTSSIRPRPCGTSRLARRRDCCATSRAVQPTAHTTRLAAHLRRRCGADKTSPPRRFSMPPPAGQSAASPRRCLPSCQASAGITLLGAARTGPVPQPQQAPAPLLPPMPWVRWRRHV